MPKPNPERDRHVARLHAALERRRAAEQTLERERAGLAAEIVDAYRTGLFKAAQIGKEVGYTPEHVRRILRAAGIQGDPSRLTPQQRAERRTGAVE